MNSHLREEAPVALRRQTAQAEPFRLAPAGEVGDAKRVGGDGAVAKSLRG